MQRISFTTFAFVSAVSLLGCDDHSVFRRVTLAVESGLPGAESTIVGSELRVRLTRIEPLAGEKSYVAWASVGGVWTRLGPVTIDSITVFDSTPLTFVWQDVEELVVGASDPAASAPSEHDVHFAGLPGEALVLGGEAAGPDPSFHDASVTAEISDTSLELTYAGMPSFGHGIDYGVWFVSAESELGEPGESFYAGVLTLSGRDMLASPNDLSTYEAIVLTLELESGVPEPAFDSIVMHGEIPPLEGAESAPSEPVTHGH